MFKRLDYCQSAACIANRWRLLHTVLSQKQPDRSSFFLDLSLLLSLSLFLSLSPSLYDLFLPALAAAAAAAGIKIVHSAEAASGEKWANTKIPFGRSNRGRKKEKKRRNRAVVKINLKERANGTRICTPNENTHTHAYGY
jgi:hypothetical protein